MKYRLTLKLSEKNMEDALKIAKRHKVDIEKVFKMGFEELKLKESVALNLQEQAERKNNE